MRRIVARFAELRATGNDAARLSRHPDHRTSLPSRTRAEGGEQHAALVRQANGNAYAWKSSPRHTQRDLLVKASRGAGGRERARKGPTHRLLVDVDAGEVGHAIARILATATGSARPERRALGDDAVAIHLDLATLRNVRLLVGIGIGVARSIDRRVPDTT